MTSASTIWWTIAGIAVLTVVIKTAGPVVLGGRDLPRGFNNVIVLVGPAVLAALVATAIFADGDRLTVGPVTVGVAAAAVVAWLGRSPLLAVLVAAVVTAAVRALV